jgi:hypothetical protein
MIAFADELRSLARDFRRLASRRGDTEHGWTLAQVAASLTTEADLLDLEERGQ